MLEIILKNLKSFTGTLQTNGEEIRGPQGAVIVPKATGVTITPCGDRIEVEFSAPPMAQKEFIGIPVSVAMNPIYIGPEGATFKVLGRTYNLYALEAPPQTFGATPRSPQWDSLREDFLADHPTCAACGGFQHLQVHHCEPFHLRPDLELDPTNLITLCQAPNRLCHIRLGHCWSWMSWNPNVREDAARELDRMQGRKDA